MTKLFFYSVFWIFPVADSSLDAIQIANSATEFVMCLWSDLLLPK